jgi:hypothetical protein
MFARRVSATMGIAALAITATPAQAQYMPHLDPNLYMLTIMNMTGGPNTCMTGLALPDKEIDEARLPAPVVMQGYFAAAQGGGKKSASFRTSKKAQWTYGSTTALLAQIDAQSDPLAITGNRLDPDTLRFFRSGNYQTAQGQWLVNGPDGKVVGLYDAVFQREKGLWKLSRLTVHGAKDAVVPATQYCLIPGDVTEEKIKSANNQISYYEKEIGKAEAKLAKAKTQLVSDEAKLAAKPGGTAQREAVRTAKKDVENREKKLADLKESLADAREYLGKSNRDKEEIAAMTLPAAEAARFRGFETTTAKEDAAEKAEKEAKKAEEDAKKKAEKEAKQAAKGN